MSERIRALEAELAETSLIAYRNGERAEKAEAEVERLKAALEAASILLSLKFGGGREKRLILTDMGRYIARGGGRDSEPARRSLDAGQADVGTPKQAAANPAARTCGCAELDDCCPHGECGG